VKKKMGYSCGQKRPAQIQNRDTVTEGLKSTVHNKKVPPPLSKLPSGEGTGSKDQN